MWLNSFNSDRFCVFFSLRKHRNGYRFILPFLNKKSQLECERIIYSVKNIGWGIKLFFGIEK